jgi:multidrug efflux pump subunit AcrA (membrane-fusion protein)
MNQLIIRGFVATIFFAVLVGCEKKETVAKEEERTKPKQDEGIVTLTKENLELVTIRTEPALKGSLQMTLRAAGRVSDNLNKTAKVASTLEGRLIKLNFDLNDRVRAGDVLGLVQTPELLGKPLELRAPIDGVITERKSTVGELVGKDTEIYTISDPADLWVIAEIKERDIGALKVGQDASFTVLAYPGEEFHGKVVRIGNRIEAESRTMEVRIDVDNANAHLKPGMFADVEIVTTILQDTLLITDTALQTDGDAQIVFVELGNSRFEKRVVKTGMEQRGRVAVLDGVKQGEQVVTEGSFILKSEMLKSELGEE